VDASAIDSQVLAVAMREDPSLARDLRVVEALGPSTIQPIAVSRRLNETVREEIRDAILAVGDDPRHRDTLDGGCVERFVPVDEASYDDIRAMLEACERAGFLTLR
jgi:ABC-type phosphate/phosphonate transport system substrate-binding protein